MFYEGLLPRARAPAPRSGRVVEGGWRVVEADGRSPIDAEVFAACVSLSVPAGAEEALVAHWAGEGAAAPPADDDAQSSFVCSALLRRDVNVKMHGAEDPASLPAGAAFSAFAFFEDARDRDAWAAAAKAAAASFAGGTTRGPAVASYEGVLVLEDPTAGA